MSNTVIPRNEDETVIQSEGIFSAEDDSGKVYHVFRDMPDYRKMLAAAVQMLDAADVISKIERGVEYIVQVPAQYQEQLKAGALEMMHGAKSGKTLAMLVQKMPNGRREIKCHCPIVEKMSIQGNPIQMLTNVYQNLFIQNQLMELSKQVQEVYDAVLRIEQGQMNDRIGKLLSGRDDVERALKNNDLEGRKREIELARSKISEAQGQIGQTFKSRIEGFEAIPIEKSICRLKQFVGLRSSDKKKDKEFHELEEYFEFYLRATQLLAWSYRIVGDRERADMVFQQSIEFLKTIDFRNVKTLDYIYPKNDMDDAFYHQYVPYFRAEQKVCLEASNAYETIQIITFGEDIQEAIVNGRETV